MTSIPQFDTSQLFLGSLCARGHDYAKTGKSLRFKKSHNCKECYRIYVRKRYRDRQDMGLCAKCPNKSEPGTTLCTRCRERRSDTRYLLTRKQYEARLKQQGGKCAICGTPANGHRLTIDHCHDTGLVRGILCSQCNSGIGFMQDDISILQSAISYLNQFN